MPHDDAASSLRQRSTGLVAGAAALLLATPVAGSLRDDRAVDVFSVQQDTVPASTELPGDGVEDAAAGPAAAARPDCVTEAAPATLRYAGADRWATAACLAEAAHPAGAATVVLARGDAAGGWADALAGTVLAHRLGAPILLTSPTSLPAATADALAALDPDEILVLGGPAAIGPAVQGAAARQAPVRRIAGASRAETAVLIAEEVGSPTTAFVVNGNRPADALVAGAAAARSGAALLLTGESGLPTVTAQYIAAGVDDVTIVGGFGVVGSAVEDALRARVGPTNLRRVAGPDRRETAASVARAFPSDGPVHLASGNGDNLVDAIGAGWTAAKDGGAVLYSGASEPGAGTDRYLRLGGLAADAEVRLIGGTGPLGPALVDAVEARRTEAAEGGPPRQLRGLWVHLLDGTLKTAAGMDRVLDAAVAANLNTIVVQAARRHDGFSTGDFLPRTSDEQAAADFLLLDRLVPAAHARGLQVHAWYSVMPSNHPTFADETLPATHVNTVHGPTSADPWTTTGRLDGYDYLDPGVPGVQDHVVAMLRDVVANHDVDAVHLDYLRYENDDSGRHPVSLDRFADHGDGNLDTWRRQQTADLARRIYAEVAEVDPTVQVSMAAIAQAAGPVGSDLRAGFRATRAYAEKFQDWTGWVDGGFMDVVMPMAYFDQGRYPEWYAQWSAYVGELARTSDATVAVGVAGYLNSVSEGLTQVDRALADGADGVVVYSYQSDTTSGQGALLAALGRTRFATPALPPVPGGKSADVAGGHLIIAAADGAVVTATPVAGGEARRVQADGAGNATFVHLPAGAWNVSGGDAGATVVMIEGGRTTRS